MNSATQQTELWQREIYKKRYR